MSHNRQMDELLTEVRQAAENAREEKDFAPIFTRLRSFKTDVGQIRYDNRARWWTFAVLATIGTAFGLTYFLRPDLQYQWGTAGLIFLGVIAAAAVGTLIAIGVSGSDIDGISDLIFDKDVYFDNKLSVVDVEGRGSDLYDEFRSKFGEFRSRGDEGRRITWMVRGEWAGKEYAFPYEYYVFRYVEVYYVTVTKKVGNTTVVTRERRTRTHYRRGLLLDFPFAKGLAVVSGGGSYDYPAGYAPTSEEFSRRFHAEAVSDIEAAKFLKPAVVLAFVEMDKYFSGLNVEVNREGRMNIAFSDSDVLDLERKHSIAEPDAFEEEIRSHLGLPKLRMLLQFAETLKKHNDSNF